jgi:hypothetical protein
VTVVESRSWTGIVPLCPRPDHATTQSEVAVTVYRPCRPYRYPHVGDDAVPYRSAYGVPAPLHVTDSPSPIDHTTRATRAVAVTVYPPADADRVTGPIV